MNGRTLLAVLALAALPARASAQVRDFQIDAGHSDVSFSIGFLGFPVRGKFDDVRGTLAWDASDITKSSISVAIPVKGLSTGSAHRDEHLRSADFFDAERYPYIVFRSTKVARTPAGFAATGTLAMHGVEREVVIPFRQVGNAIEDPHGTTLLLFSGVTRLARADFGIVGGSKFNPWFDAMRSATMADSVDVTLDVELWDPDYTRNTSYDRQLAKIAAQGVDSVLAPLRRMVAEKPDTLAGADWELSQVAAALMTRGKPRDALTVLRFAAVASPKSPRVLAMLARAEDANGDRAAARTAVRHALEVDAYNTWAMEIARRLDGPSR